MIADDLPLAIESLSSCAIEGNQWAIKLLELRNRDMDAFLKELYKSVLIGGDDERSQLCKPGSKQEAG